MLQTPSSSVRSRVRFFGFRRFPLLLNPANLAAGTRENLKMIAAQRDALEAARKSREDALTATKVSR